uniref:Uncharacterized protein n=1 Tax=Ditylenchus dipsaci TaxID=166011 RepID=A0A915ETL6_9BILA
MDTQPARSVMTAKATQSTTTARLAPLNVSNISTKVAADAQSPSSTEMPVSVGVLQATAAASQRYQPDVSVSVNIKNLNHHHALHRVFTIVSHLVPDVNQTGLRTKKAERAAKNRKRRAMDLVPVKEKKLRKESRENTATLDLTELSGEGLNIIKGLGLKEDRVLANRFGNQRQRYLDKLEPGQCLNDDVINYYLQLVAKRNSGKVMFVACCFTVFTSITVSRQTCRQGGFFGVEVDLRCRPFSCAAAAHLLAGSLDVGCGSE